jgi:hypothetical protein
MAAPGPIVQIPEQQSAGLAHASPIWMQKDDASWHVPALQSCEQHCELFVQALPAVLQDRLRAPHAPFWHLPEQQEASALHACPSDTHIESEHLPPTHAIVWQSVLTAQAPPPGTTELNVDVQWLVVSHTPEQHEPPEAHGSP